MCVHVYARIYVALQERGTASYTLNSVRMSPNGEIVINLSVKIQTRPGFPNNLLRTRGGTRCDTPTLSLSTRFTDSRQPSQPSVRPRPRAALNRIRSSMPFLSAERTSNGDENATIEKRNYVKIGRRESSSLEQVCVENSPGKDIFLSDTRRRFRGRRGRRRSYSVNNSRGNSNRAVAISRGGRKKAEIAGRTRTDHATLAFFKRATILRPFDEKIPPQLFFLSMLTNARLNTGGRKKRKLKAVPILGLVSITPPLVSWIAGRGGCSKYSVLNVLGEGD